MTNVPETPFPPTSSNNFDYLSFTGIVLHLEWNIAKKMHGSLHCPENSGPPMPGPRNWDSLSLNGN
jgi:hypothetical protein